MTEVLESARKKDLKEIVGTQDLLLTDEPTVLFHPIRILIMKTLYRHGQVDFRDLKSELDLTAGNLASHLRALKKTNHITEHKVIVERRPRTTIETTLKGRKAFENFRKSLKKVLENE
jgi:DNA-binding MarR family transcriptional regulator